MATVHEISDFQVKFLKEIERSVESETGFDEFSAVEQFQVRSCFLVQLANAVQSDLLPSPTGNPRDKSSFSASGMRNCLKQSCPGGRGWGKSKITSLKIHIMALASLDFQNFLFEFLARFA